MVRRSCSICSRCRFIGTSIFATKSSPYNTRRPCFMSRISIAKTSAACRNSSCVKKSGAGSFCSTHHHFTAPASRPSSSTVRERKMHTTLRSECPPRKSPRAAEPNKMTHSRLLAANSFNRFTSSVSFVSVESIFASFLKPGPGFTSLLTLPRPRCSRRPTRQIPLPPSHRIRPPTHPPPSPPPNRLPIPPPPPLLPPPNPPNPPPPQPPDPPPNPPPPEPPPQLPRDPRPELAIIPSKNHNRPLPPDPPPRSPRPPEARPRNENRIINPTKSQKIPLPPPLFL